MRVRIDRHAFASNASSFDTAWRTFGWTPEIEGERAGRLEEAVPWATLTSRAERPAWLRGAAAEVLDAANFDRLHFAFLPLDGRFGFSVWGAIGDDRGAGGWRVLTHTLLFDRAAFQLLAGYPFGLLTDRAGGAWFREMVERAAFDRPAPLAPVVLPFDAVTRSRFEQARLAEVERLRDRLAEAGGQGESLERRLAALYEAVAAASRGGAVRRVALRGNGASVEESMLVRLTWLTLPPRDRANTFFTTEQHRTASPAATLLVLPESEWGPFAPEATRLLGVDPPYPGDEATAGRRHWARMVVRDVAGHAQLCARVNARGWALIARDDVTRMEALERWREKASVAPPSLRDVRELIAIECAAAGTGGRVRWRAIGRAIGCALCGPDRHAADAPRAALALLRQIPPRYCGAALRAALRVLPAFAIEAMVRESESNWLWRDEVLTTLTATLYTRAANAAAAPGATCVAMALLGKLLVSAQGHALSAIRTEAVLRLSWIEIVHGAGVTAVERHGVDHPHAAVPLLLQLLVSSPPLPLFLRVRRLLLRLPASHFAGRPEVERWRAPLEECCPALITRFPRERRERILDVPLTRTK